MTWNVKCFDLYNWSMNKETAEKMMNIIKKENPDILCLQEFYTDNNKFHNLEFIRDKLGFQYVHFHNTLTLRNSERWGIVTFSKYPIVDKQELIFENSKHNACIITSIDINGKVYKMMNMHLQSLHLAYADYDYMEQVKADLKSSDIEKTNSIFSKLKKAFQKRAHQIDIINKNKTGDHLILCGDFNDISISYTYEQLSRKMKDVFIEKGNGFSKTMDLFVPYLRIDFILVDKEIVVNSYKRIKKNLSDHYPVITTVE